MVKSLEEILERKGFTKDQFSTDDEMKIVADSILEYLSLYPAISTHEVINTIKALIKRKEPEGVYLSKKGVTLTFGKEGKPIYDCNKYCNKNNPHLEDYRLNRIIISKAIIKYFPGQTPNYSENGINHQSSVFYLEERKLVQYLRDRLNLQKEVQLGV